eukprot:COSAG04_NODE_414_length_14737_cov_79.200779_1_plen_99_part_10
MEFKDLRGNSTDAWSVGKFAKRSATIHLCSEDCQTQENKTFSAVIVSYDLDVNGAGNITVFDPRVGVRIGGHPGIFKALLHSPEYPGVKGHRRRDLLDR